jgi:hypothetical protein
MKHPVVADQKNTQKFVRLYISKDRQRIGIHTPNRREIYA